MQLLSVIFSQSLRIVRSTNPMGTIYMPDAIKELENRYGFLEVPKSLQEYDLQKGINFLHGKFSLKKRMHFKGMLDAVRTDELVIDRLQLFHNGLLVETRSYVESADMFLDDVIDWGTERFGLRLLEDPPIRKVFSSQVEVKFNQSPIPALVPRQGGVIKSLAANFKAYGLEWPQFEASGISFHCDTKTAEVPAPTFFGLERRTGFPYSSNIFFSTAPLLTRDHLKLLESLDTE